MGKISKDIQKDLEAIRSGSAGFTDSPLGDRGEEREIIKSLAQIPSIEAMESEGPKKGVFLRIKPRVLAFFRGQHPRGYQKRINAVLERFVEIQATGKKQPVAAAKRGFSLRSHGSHKSALYSKTVRFSDGKIAQKVAAKKRHSVRRAAAKR